MPRFQIRPWLWIVPYLLLLFLAACGAGQSTPAAAPADATRTSRLTAFPPVTPTPGLPAVDVTLAKKDVTVAPLPLRAGFPFTITAQIHNNVGTPALGVPLMVYISPQQEEMGYQSFLEVLTVTLPTTRPVTLKIPVHWNFAGGEHRLWVQVNRLPKAWQLEAPVQLEADTSDNSVLLDLQIQPFDAYESDLCPGRVDVELSPTDVSAGPDQQQVLVLVHNVGNRAVYNLPVVVRGQQLAGIAYTPAIPPCGGTAQVWVPVDRQLKSQEPFSVDVNPQGWEGGLSEDEFGNNQVAATVSLLPGESSASGASTAEYDLAISAADITSPEPFIILVTVHNLGTRDAADVPIRVENQAGRKIADTIPLVQGNGQGVAAIRVGILWTRGGILTLTVNPSGAKGAYPESDRSNNSATFKLP